MFVVETTVAAVLVMEAAVAAVGVVVASAHIVGVEMASQHLHMHRCLILHHTWKTFQRPSNKYQQAFLDSPSIFKIHKSMYDYKEIWTNWVLSINDVMELLI